MHGFPDPHPAGPDDLTDQVIALRLGGRLGGVSLHLHQERLGARRDQLRVSARQGLKDTLDAIGAPDRIDPWIRERVLAGDRIMGFGHPVYRTEDSRSRMLRDIAQHFGGPRVAFAVEVERQVEAILAELKPGRELHTNVEFYAGAVMELCGLPREPPDRSRGARVCAQSRRPAALTAAVMGRTRQQGAAGSFREPDPRADRSGACRHASGMSFFARSRVSRVMITIRSCSARAASGGSSLSRMAVASVPMTAKFPSLNSKMSGHVCPEPLPRSWGEAPTRRTIFKSVPSS
ncbi:hypothetical protein STRIP9103_07385 [Streptomyces ipomoeae 91-03]|uniref:citrate synthase (unknown stereospecificity) n=1 Tax=Streptomyces ipomoeae 91-03 TaxID=698759 RepID=L1KMG9_9ACTN|nr:hypothetical protein STRIP9103_07385 [Streptomyces ipomoeae 91-03]